MSKRTRLTRPRPKLRELNDLLKVGAKLRVKGAELQKLLSSEVSARVAALNDELALPPPTSAADVGLTAACDTRIEAPAAAKVGK